MLRPGRLARRLSSFPPNATPFYVPYGNHHSKRLQRTTLLSSLCFSLVAGAEAYGWNEPPSSSSMDAMTSVWTQFTSGSVLHYAGMAISLAWLASNQVDAAVTVSEMRVGLDQEGKEDMLYIRPYNLLGQPSKSRVFEFHLRDLEFQGYGTKPNLFFVKGTGDTLGKRRVFMFDRVQHVEELFGTHRKSGMLPPPPPTTSRFSNDDSLDGDAPKYKSKRRRGF